jgi:Mg/Co/Ni transporter MgtE
MLDAPKPPRVLGLVVEVAPRRRIFLPMTRVTAVQPGEVVVTGVVNLRRFEPRSGEVLALGELVDSRVTLRESGDEVIVLDMAMEQRRTRDWEVTKVYVARRGRTLRRKGQQSVVNVEDVTGFVTDQANQGTDTFVASMEKLRPADLAALLAELSPKRRAEVASALDDDRLADVLEEMTEEESIEILAQLGDERAADVLEAMGPDDAADVMADLPEETRLRLLALMEPDEAADVRRLLTYDDYTAGGLMTTEPIVLAPDATVAEALATSRSPDLPPALAAQVYVCRPPLDTPTGRYLGAVHFQRLLREQPSTLISEVIDTELDPLGPDATLQQVTSVLASYNLVAIPVVDDADRLLGSVTVDDVVDHMLPGDWRRRDFHAAHDVETEAYGGT